MSRMIKFRGWDKIRGRLVGLETLHLDGRGVGHVAEWDYPNVIMDARDMCLSQFIGVNDRNGKEIYEGDICEFLIGVSREEYIEHNVCIDGALVVVEMQNATWGFRRLHPELVMEEDKLWRSFWENDSRTMWDADYFRVVGDIYRNPELLRREK